MKPLNIFSLSDLFPYQSGVGLNVLFVEEVKNAIFSLNGDGAPSPDRYGGCFF